MTDDGISVIIPAYNVGGFIAEAIASVVAQTRPVHEIIVIDDGSTDGTAMRLGKLAATDARMRILTSERLGPGGARNAGLIRATRPIIAFLDGDDVWPTDKIARQMQRLAAGDRPDVVSGLIQRFCRLAPRGPTPDNAEFPIIAHVNLGACLFRRQVFDAIGFFDERLSCCEDVDLMFRIREAGLKLAIVREVTLYYRIRPGSLTQTKLSQSQKERGALEALRLSLGRRRSSGRAQELPPFTGLVDE